MYLYQQICSMYSSQQLFINSETELAQLVLSHPAALLYLEHFGIFVPFQHKTIGIICREYRIGIPLFTALSQLYTGQKDIQTNQLSFSDIPVITDYLKNSHRYYLDEIYPNIQSSVKSLYEADQSGTYQIIDSFYQQYFNEVREHLNYENEVAFPYIMSLTDCYNTGKPFQNADDYSVSNYKDHHDDIEEKIDDLMNLIIRHLPENNDQLARRRLFLSLSQLDFDLKIHTLIEDLILTPLVEQLENALNQQK